MKRIELRIDVTDAAALGEPLTLAATISLPEPAVRTGRQVAIFAAPGGGYSRSYFFLRLEGHASYDEAEYHAGRGMIHVAIDPIGVGESSIPDLSKITFQTLAATHDACVRQIAGMIEAGALSEDFPACPGLFKVGMGQSLGGGITILTQGRFGTFDAIAPCGMSAIHTVLPQPTAAQYEAGMRRFDGVALGGGSMLESVDKAGVDFVYAFFWDDVPGDIIAQDVEGGHPSRRTAPPFGSTTVPGCAVQMMTPGAFASEAAAVTVPVLVANGERDVCPAPYAEASAYRASRDLSVFVIPAMAHMHNFASTRSLLWQRLHDWSLMVSRQP